MYGWNDRPSKAEVAHEIGGENPATVYRIGKYEVAVRADGVTYCVPSWHTSSDPRRTLPNMEISDGEIRIPVVDLVGEVLARLDPVDLARELWTNDEVKAAFMEALVSRYASDSLGDAERRAFLHGVKEAVHDVGQGRAIDLLQSLENRASQRWSVWQEIGQANAALEAADAKWPDGTPMRLRDPSNEPEFKIGGASWNEARDHWREALVAMFPGPEPGEPPADSETDALA